MKFTAERKDLLKALVLANSVVERSNTVPLLANVLLSAADGVLRLVATDLDLQISLGVSAEVSTPGRITVQAAMFQDIVRKLPDGSEVSCELIDNQFHVRAGRSRLKMFTLPAQDFPDLDAGRTQSEFSIEASDLVRLIRKAGFAVSTDESRYYLNGVYLHSRPGNELACVGTDGHRLSLAWMVAPEGAQSLSGVIIPRKTSGLIGKHIDGYSGPVTVRASEQKISFQWGSTVLISKLIDGSYPDYNRVIPKSNPNVVRADVKALIGAVDRVTTVSSDKTRACRFEFQPEDKLEVAMVVPDGGTAEETVDLEYRGAPLAIGFNARYVMDVLSSIEGEGVIWELGDPGAPSILRPEDGDTSSMAVLMPMRY